MIALRCLDKASEMAEHTQKLSITGLYNAHMPYRDYRLDKELRMRSPALLS